MTRIDLKKDLKHLYNADTRDVHIVDIPPIKYLMIDGKGDPNTALEYQQAIETLVPLSHTLRFMSKLGANIDYAVMPLESLWWRKDIADDGIPLLESLFFWTCMMMQPDHITPQLVDMAINAARNSKDLPAINKTYFETLHEGLCAQVMHTGSYNEEAATIQKLHTYIRTNGYELTDKHHEIYLNDPQHTALEELKTIVRQPIKRIKRHA